MVVFLAYACLLLLLPLLQANKKTTKEEKRLRSFPARKFAVKA